MRKSDLLVPLFAGLTACASASPHAEIPEASKLQVDIPDAKDGFLAVEKWPDLQPPGKTSATRCTGNFGSG